MKNVVVASIIGLLGAFASACNPLCHPVSCGPCPPALVVFVTDAADGGSVPDAQVTATPSYGGDSCATTGSQTRCEIFAQGPGEVTLTVSASGYETVSETATVSPGPRSSDLCACGACAHGEASVALQPIAPDAGT